MGAAPEAPGGEATKITEALGGAPRAKPPGRPAPDPDLEATTQHQAVSAEPKATGEETVVASRPSTEGPKADATVVARPVPKAAQKTAAQKTAAQKTGAETELVQAV